MSKWWKCDLQVASPWAKDFRGPSEPPWNLENDHGVGDAVKRYMAAVVKAGIEVIALADHNDAAHVSELVAAGRDAGVTVFPGVEITTGSGSDGVHLIIIGDENKRAEDFEWVLSAACGFGPSHPRFDPVSGNPASSPRTLAQILDELPTDYLVLAPHAFNDNGIASRDTVKGDLRWKALHHPRLAAIDVGDGAAISRAGSFRARFVKRELTDFPCLKDLAFISTSDAYSLDRLGERFTWIRMSAPSLEGLRQAFLDHDARIACDWDPRFTGGQTPNDVRHPWVESICIDGLAVSSERIEVALDPRLTVIIGGRGSGKSTLVTAVRSLYGESDSLPPQALAEHKSVIDGVFSGAQVVGTHRLAHNGEVQAATWTYGSGSHRTDPSTLDVSAHRTDFKVRVVNQKELFERAAHRIDDPFSTSRNLLALVDDAIVASSSVRRESEFDVQLAELQTSWIASARELQLEIEATGHQVAVGQRVEELSRQVAAYDSESNAVRRRVNDSRLARAAWLEARARAADSELLAVAEAIKRETGATHTIPQGITELEADASEQGFGNIAAAFESERVKLRAKLIAEIDATRERLTAINLRRQTGRWQTAVEAARTDSTAYRAELEALGLDPAHYDEVRQSLERESTALASLKQRAALLPQRGESARDKWQAVDRILAARRERRRALLEAVADRSGMLRFELVPVSDVGAWVSRVRDLLNLRADGFLDDVPALGEWLWTSQDPGEATRRQGLWRAACVSGDFEAVGGEAAIRPAWQQRLTGLDPLVRARVGAEVAEDTVIVEFLREHGKRDQPTDWRPLTAGSPGQRSAAMLSFVLHHGTEPLILDQPEDDLDTEWITQLVVTQLRRSRLSRQIVVVTHNANIPVNADAERVVVMETDAEGVHVRRTNGVEHVGPLEEPLVRTAIQQIMEGGIEAFVRRERRYNNELDSYKAAVHGLDR